MHVFLRYSQIKIYFFSRIHISFLRFILYDLLTIKMIKEQNLNKTLLSRYEQSNSL